MVAKDDVKARYMACLKREIELRGKEFGNAYQVTTVYIGGGTPSCLASGEIKSLMQTVYRCFTVNNDAEITIEINPNSLTKEKVSEYLFAGCNRFSLGLQSTSKHVLAAMKRPDSAENFINAVNMLKEQGVSNISADLILGYPGQTLEDVKTSVNLLNKLNIPHVSTYMLSVEEGTELKKQLDSKTVTLPSEDSVIAMYNHVVRALRAEGIERYEVSNFARAGFKSRHNQVYWKRWNYLGLGLASHSFLRHQRFANTSDIVTYIGFLEKSNQIPVCDSKMISENEAKEEIIMLSLRTSEGLDTAEFKREFGENFLAKNKAKLAKFIRGGFIILDPKTNNICATDKGFLVLNKIIADLA